MASSFSKQNGKKQAGAKPSQKHGGRKQIKNTSGKKQFRLEKSF